MNKKRVVDIIDDEYETEYLSKISPEARKKVNARAQRLKTGLHVQSPVICPGFDKCIWSSHCPLAQITEHGEIVEGDRADYPIGRSCVLEREYQKEKIQDYYSQLDADPDNPIEVGWVNELALCDLLKNRALMILSAGDRRGQGMDFMRTDVTGAMTSDNGVTTTFHSTQIHPAYAVIESIEKRRAALLDKLMQTREARFKIQMKVGSAQQESKLLMELREIRQHLSTAQHALIPAEKEIEIE